MTTYCKAGDIARITLPDGTIKDFTDTPVSITCEDDFSGSSRRYRVDWTIVVTYSSGSRQTFASYDFFWSPTGEGFQIRVFTNQYSLVVQIYSAGSRLTASSAGFWMNILTADKTATASGAITSVKPYDTASPPIKKRIKIIGNSANELHNAIYDTCNYSVNCIVGCPPNTMDCGDCCLDCAAIFNEISALRSLISRIKNN